MKRRTEAALLKSQKSTKKRFSFSSHNKCEHEKHLTFVTQMQSRQWKQAEMETSMETRHRREYFKKVPPAFKTQPNPSHPRRKFLQSTKEQSKQKHIMNLCFFSKKTTPSIPVASKSHKTKEIGYDGLPIGTRKLNFHVDTGTTFGSEKIPLVYGSLDNPAEVVATVVFDTDEDCTGDSVDVTFKASAFVRANGMYRALFLFPLVLLGIARPNIFCTHETPVLFPGTL